MEEKLSGDRWRQNIQVFSLHIHMDCKQCRKGSLSIAMLLQFRFRLQFAENRLSMVRHFGVTGGSNGNADRC